MDHKTKEAMDLQLDRAFLQFMLVAHSGVAIHGVTDRQELESLRKEIVGHQKAEKFSPVCEIFDTPTGANLSIILPGKDGDTTLSIAIGDEEEVTATKRSNDGNSHLDISTSFHIVDDVFNWECIFGLPIEGKWTLCRVSFRFAARLNESDKYRREGTISVRLAVDDMDNEVSEIYSKTLEEKIEERSKQALVFVEQAIKNVAIQRGWEEQEEG